MHEQFISVQPEVENLDSDFLAIHWACKKVTLVIVNVFDFANIKLLIFYNFCENVIQAKLQKGVCKSTLAIIMVIPSMLCLLGFLIISYYFK